MTDDRDDQIDSSEQDETKLIYGWTMLSIEIGGWAPLGQDKVALDLDSRRTVLVGRNGAGKSALIEGILLALDDSIRGPRNGPRHFRAVFKDHNDARFIYEHSWEPKSREGSSQGSLTEGKPQQHWTERCWHNDSDDNSVVWEMKDGKAFLGTTEIPVPEDGSLPYELHSKEISESEGYADLSPRWFALFCRQAKRVFAGIPHAVAPRDGATYRTGMALFFKEGKKPDPQEQEEQDWQLIGSTPKRFSDMLWTLFRWYRADAESGNFSEFVTLGQKVGVFKTFNVSVVGPAEGPSYAQLMVDGVNIGRAPDGTLRVSEIICAMLGLNGRSILLLEEPETGIHPGALVSLLSILESYAEDRQFLISTHSPVLLSQVSASELRIVYRRDGRTHVRALSANEIERAGAFLTQQGTLDEFVLSGAIDDES